MRTIHAIFEHGIFRPTEPVSLPAGTEVDVVAPDAEGEAPSVAVSGGLAEVYAILGERHESGHADTAQRHNEHQP